MFLPDQLKEYDYLQLGSHVLSKETEDIATRVVLPPTSHKLKSMIDNLYSKEKKYIYSKQYVREECLGNQNIIFNLEKSQLVNKVPIITNPP